MARPGWMVVAVNALGNRRPQHLFHCLPQSPPLSADDPPVGHGLVPSRRHSSQLARCRYLTLSNASDVEVTGSERDEQSQTTGEATSVARVRRGFAGRSSKRESGHRARAVHGRGLAARVRRRSIYRRGLPGGASLRGTRRSRKQSSNLCRLKLFGLLSQS